MAGQGNLYTHMAKKNLKQANDKLVNVAHGNAGRKRHNQQASYVASSLSHLLARSVIATATVTVAFTVALSAQVCSVQPASAQDASGRQIKDFKHRKRMIVAPSENVRRIDYQSLPGRDSLMLPNYVPKFPPAGAGGSSPRYTDPYASGLPPANMNQEGMLNDGGLSAEAGTLGSTNQSGPSGTSTTGRKPMTKTSRAGLTPPPPPIKSGLLPQSLTKELPAKSPTVAHTGTANSAWAPPLSQQKVAQIKAQAEALVKKGKASEAQTLLGGYVKTYPHEKALSTELSKISLHRAQGHAKAGNHEAATQQARLAITHGENAPEIIQAAHGTLNSSLQKIGVKANSPEDRFDLGTKLMGQARYDEAAIEYSAAAKLKPSVEAYLGAGGASMKGGHQLQAKKYFQEALELNPESQPALRELGIARYHLKDYAGASADLTRALVINSGDKEAAHTLLELWHHQVASRPTDANAHLGLARAYQVAGDLPAAQNEYKTVVKIHPQHPNLPAARQSFKLAYARQESRKAYELAQTLESQGSLLSAYQKASDAVHLFPSETLYQSYAAQLAAKLQASAQNPGANNFAAAGAGMSAMANSALTASPSAMDAQITQGMNGMANSQTVPSTPSQQSTLVPGSTPEAPPSLIPTAQAMGLAPAAAPVISSAPFAHENMYQPISTDRQVSSMSNFLVSLRNFTMQQQNQIQDAEDSSIWNQGTTRKKSILPGLGSTADLAADGALSGIAAPSGLPSSLPSGVQTAPPSSDVADVLKNAALALANTKSGSSLPLTAPSFSASAVTSTINSATTATTATNPADSVATAASIAAAAPVAAATIPPANPYAALAIQAAQTAAQKAANRFTTKSAAAKPVAATSTSAQMAAPSQSWVPAPSPAPTAPPPQDNQMAEMNAPQSNSLTSSQFNNMPIGQYNNSQNGQFNSPPNGQFTGIDANSPLASNATASQYAPPQMVAAQPVPQALPQALQTAQANGSVKLLLQGVKAAKDDVQLKVLLRNETAQEIKLPSNMKATVRSASQGERQGKASFAGKTVSPGASVTGTIKIQGSSLDPTADVVIPASSLAILGMGDLHLTVPISQR